MKTRSDIEYKRLRNTYKKWKKSTKGKEALRQMLISQNNKCAICGKEVKFFESGDSVEDIRIYAEVDHIIALAVGGANNMSNFQIVCMLCNIKKGIK